MRFAARYSSCRRTSRRRTLLAALAATCFAFSAQAQEQEFTGTLKKIQDDGVVVLGVRAASTPFSYFDGQGTVGYSQAIALAIVEQIKKTLARPELKVREVTITSSNRILMLQNNQIDLECSSTAHTHERESEAAFSDSFFQYAVRMIVRRGSGIADFPDLAGKTVVTTAGTTDERLLRQMNSEKHLNMRIVSVRDHPDAFSALKDGRAAAFVMDEPIMYGLKAADPHPDDFVVTGTPLAYEVYACMFRKGDPQLVELANGVIERMQTSGEAEHLYNVWFTQPIPPHGINLNFPLSAAMRALFAHPNDHMLD